MDKSYEQIGAGLLVRLITSVFPGTCGRLFECQASILTGTGYGFLLSSCS
jgi:hypothetical protein